MNTTILEVDVDTETGQRTSTLRTMPFQNVSLIITHDGLFHADEVFAIALIHVFVREIPFIRTRKLQNALTEPSIMVLDQGNSHNEELNNFDHHHLKTQAPFATVGMILNYLFDNHVISADQMGVIRPSINTISHYDIHGPYSFNGFQMNEAIRMLNQFDEDENVSFNEALRQAVSFLKSAKRFADIQIPISHKLWKDGRSLDGIKICSKFPILWKSYNEEQWLVCQAKDGLWQVHCAKGQPSITHAEKAIFPKGLKPDEVCFMAGFELKTDAVTCALKSSKAILG